MIFVRHQISLLFLVLLGYVYVAAVPKFPFAPSSSAAPTPPPNAPTALCPMGLAFKADCNNCFCNPSTGVTGCTLMACPTPEPMAFYQNTAPKPAGGTAQAVLRPSRADAAAAKAKAPAPIAAPVAQIARDALVAEEDEEEDASE